MTVRSRERAIGAMVFALLACSALVQAAERWTPQLESHVTDMANAMKERAVRIELGLGMQQFISNAAAQRMVDEKMLPHFHNGEYAAGIREGTEQLMREARAFVVEPAETRRESTTR